VAGHRDEDYHRLKEKAAVTGDSVLLKQNGMFAIADARGDIKAGNQEGFGLYRSDCRFLSAYELKLNAETPILLSHSVDKAYVATFQLVNPTIDDGERVIPRQTLSLRRTRFLQKGFHERIGIKNCSGGPVEVVLQFHFDADFRDIFEVRGYYRRSRRGEREPVEATETGFLFSYRGQDGVRRATEIVLHPTPELHENGHATIRAHLEPHGDPHGRDVLIAVVDILPLLGGERPEPDQSFDASLAGLKRAYDRWNRSSTRFSTSNEVLDQTLLWRNLEDLRVLCDEQPGGLLPTAGIPWYAVPFGRDAIITSIQSMALNPDLAEGSLRYLARHQGTRLDSFQEEEPGKIFHEIRFGELANLHKIPHTPYYGTIDATPLFCALLVDLIDWTGDLDLFSELWDNARRALEWMNTYGDLDADGLIEYGDRGHRAPGVRLKNRGWKDSDESLLYDDGEVPEVPIALVEVQGYVYQAKVGLARILRHRGQTEMAERLEREAERVRATFERCFWMEGEGFYAQALDGRKRQVSAITSNPGHCLWSGLISRDRAGLVVKRLMADDMFSGWGIRTLSNRSCHYNPMSYHNGSVWPHDNSIIAAGMRRYGFREEAERVARSVIEACMRFPDDRIPELYCGFGRDLIFGAGPAQYLVSCSPQAWGAGALFHFIRTLAGVEADMLEHRLRIDPLETHLFGTLRVEGMRVGDGTLDFTVHYQDGRPKVQVDRRPHAVRKLELPS
jgi:glycogen debranching enzyme